MSENNIPPYVDVAEELSRLTGHSATIQNVMGAFRLKIPPTASFPWAEVFRLLLRHDFKVDITREDPDLIIEARP
jgi:hypothetical protein